MTNPVQSGDLGASEQGSDTHRVAETPVVSALRWALPLAKIAMEDHRMARVKAGHKMAATRSDGQVIVGYYQSEVDEIERAQEALRKATGETQ